MPAFSAGCVFRQPAEFLARPVAPEPDMTIGSDPMGEVLAAVMAVPAWVARAMSVEDDPCEPGEHGIDKTVAVPAR